VADLTYDPTDPEYIQYNNALPGFISYMRPIMKKFRTLYHLDKAAAKAWAKDDPLLLGFIDMLIEGKEYIEGLQEGTEQW
jgi:hypothetical protein